jgi:hypothetical protein
MFRIFTKAHREARRTRRFADANLCPEFTDQEESELSAAAGVRGGGGGGGTPTIMLQGEVGKST